MIMFYKEKFEKPAEESDEKQTQIRESGIELLKIFAIIVIVISHVTQTLSCENLFLPYNDYVLDVSAATTDISKFILILFRHFGVWGNAIFFVCSAWFLLGSSKYNKKKWFYMLIEVWVVSIIVLITAFIIRDGNLSGKMIIKSILPNTFANNWYITCYLLFYPVHSFLNSLIKAMNKQTLFRISAAMFMLYCCFNFVISGRFFSSPIILWITIYFIMAYLRFYMNDFSNDKKKNLFLFAAGIIGFVGIIIIINILGLHIPLFHNQVLHWSQNCNPFLIAVSIAMFNIMRNFKFKNLMINYISSLSLLIYIIHENLILRTYFRPALFQYVYHNIYRGGV